jgi:hypothetical protein
MPDATVKTCPTGAAVAVAGTRALIGQQQQTGRRGAGSGLGGDSAGRWWQQPPQLFTSAFLPAAG